MKKYLLFLLLTGLSTALLAQAPHAFNFQTIVRNETGLVVPLQDVTLLFSIRQGDAVGEIVYQEQHLKTTNSQGLVSLSIGTGEVLQGDFNLINWPEGDYFLEEQIDIGNTGEFQVFGTVQFLSVPYAQHANTSGNGIQSMTTEERDALEDPNVGMQIFNITTNCLNYWNGTNWFEACGECTPQPSVANAGPDQTYLDSTTVVQLAANTPAVGEGVWEKMSSYPGYFEDATDPNTKFHGTHCRTYYLKWIIYTTCGSKTDYVKIIYDNTPSEAHAGQDTVVNTEVTTILLNAQTPENGIGEWTIISGTGGTFANYNDPHSEFTGLACTVYELAWAVSTECASNADTVGIEFYAIPTQANAGEDITINDDNLSVVLDANQPVVGSGAWVILSGEGGTLDDSNNPTATFTGQPCTTYQLMWEISTACEVSTDTVMVDFFTIPTLADAGENQLGLEGSWTTLAANTPEIGEGLWTILQGEGGQVTTPNSPCSIFLGQINQHYILEWQISTACDTMRDEVNVAFGFVPFLNCGNMIVDERDGQEYATVQIGSQCWMAENLNIGTKVDGWQYNNGVIEKNCYDNSETNCEIYGGEYSWDEMMQYSPTPGIQGICPDGWHLPTDTEWCTLTTFLDETVDCFAIGNMSGVDAGGKMKEAGTTHWNSPNVGATNSSGFTALPGAGRNSNGWEYWGLGNVGVFWTSTQKDNNYAWHRLMDTEYAEVQRSYYDKNTSVPVRCAKDNDIPVNQQPQSPSMPLPQNNSANIAIDTTLSWSCSDPENDPLTFDVYFGDTETPPQVATGIADTFYTPGTLEYSTTYYWKVVAHDDHGNSTEGEVWSFTTIYQQGYIPTDGLAGWWPFNGNANDESGNENNGILNNVGAVPSKTGESSGAYEFNGEDSYIRLPNPFFGGNQVSEFSMFARVKPTQAGNIWGKSFSWGEVNFGIHTEHISFVWANSNNGNTYSAINYNEPIQMNEWTDVVLTFQNSGGCLYINGVQVPISYHWIAQGGGTISTSTVNSLVNFAQDNNSNNIGYKITSGQPNYFYDGIIDAFAIWDR
nr:hypothetical protein [Bacteroidota bacterium]